MTVTNTFITTDANVNRETLSDVVSRITPEDTPIVSMVGGGTTTGTHPEWGIDDLDVPAANVQAEGDTFAFAAVTPVVRVGNHTQIFTKDFVISGTQEAVDNAGNVEKTKEQKLKKALEIRKDIEFSVLSDVASLAGTSRVSGGLPSWYETNVSRGATGANGGFNQGTGLTVASTLGTQRAFAKADLDSVMESIFTAGGNVKFASVSSFVKTVFVTFMSDSNVAQFRYAADGGARTIVANADVYESAHGEIAIMPNRVQSTNAAVARNVHLIDPETVAIPALREIHEVPNLAVVSDATKGVVLAEKYLNMKNEQACGVVADVFGINATT